MTRLQQELWEFLQEKGVTPSFYPYTRGSKVIMFSVIGNKEHSAVIKLMGHTFSNGKHRLTFSSMQYGGYACNFQPLR